MRVSRLLKLFAVAFLFSAVGAVMFAQSTTTGDKVYENPDETKQELLQQQADNIYENEKHERFERIANNDLTADMRLEMEAAKNKAVLERRLEKLITLRDNAIAAGEPTGKYDSAITTIKEDLL